MDYMELAGLALSSTSADACVLSRMKDYKHPQCNCRTAWVRTFDLEPPRGHTLPTLCTDHELQLKQGSHQFYGVI